MNRDRSSASVRQLARLIRQSSVLDAHLKRQWLRVLPHLTVGDRARLEDILRSNQPAGERTPVLEGESTAPPRS